MSGLRYNSYAAYFRTTYGERLQKVAIDAGFSCPNRDLRDRSKGGCVFCNNSAFNPSYCSPDKGICRQIDEGILFHRQRYPNTTRYLAYFQPYSNTFAPLDTLKARYEEALAHPDIVGLIIGTRPDCVDEAKLDYLASLAERNGTYVAVEYGIESCYDATLDAIGRGHDFAATRRAIALTHSRGLHCGAHLVLGLPGETRQMIVDEADAINSLPIDTLKLHQLQIIVGTRLEEQVKRAMEHTADPYAALHSMGVCDDIVRKESYVQLVCDMLERLRPDIMMERFAGEVPPRFQALPQLGWRRADGRLLRNEEVPQMVNSELERRGSRQGTKCNCEF